MLEYHCDAWDKLLYAMGSLASTPGKDNLIRYCGCYYDIGTGWHYLRSRYNSSDNDRFINADDLTFFGATGTALYRSCEMGCLLAKLG